MCGASECTWNDNHVQGVRYPLRTPYCKLSNPKMIEMMFLALPLLCPLVWLLSCSQTCSSLLVHFSTNSPILCWSFLDWIDSNKQPFKSWWSNMQSLKRAHRDNLSLYFEGEILYKLQGLEMVFTTSPPKLLILLVSPRSVLITSRMMQKSTAKN